ncbi:MAG: PAP/fibrillin family protein [Trichodesmium sp. MAG_R03]|nr:PAP/fibrillin family protein [Trichodesmium sp. MAG_R03]
MDNQLLKRKLQGKIKNLQTINDGSPLTNLKLDKTIEKEIEKLTKELENLNPHPLPLLYTPYLLEGTWQLQYSTAREIRFLDSLPLGLKVGKVYQVINVGDKAFFNIAEVQDFLKLISGSVKVTASFEPAINTSGLADKRINVYFDQRYLSIEKILGIDTPQLNPFKVIKANNPQGRIPTLDTTYIDETLRIGRGGDEGLFILNKVNV